MNDDTVTIIQTVLVSANSAGVLGDGTSESGPASLSREGRYVAFASTSRNLSPDDIDSKWDIFVRDTWSGTTELISRASGIDGMKSDKDSGAPRISPDGRWVVFHSEATNLGPGTLTSEYRIYLRDRLQLETRMVSLSLAGGDPDGACKYPSLSVTAGFTTTGSGQGAPDPKINIAFESSATNLTDDLYYNSSGGPFVADNGVSDIFVAIDVLGTQGVSANYLVSRRSGETTKGLAGLTSCNNQPVVNKTGVISADGKIVTFLSNEHRMGFPLESLACQETLTEKTFVLFAKQIDDAHATTPISLGYGDHDESINCFAGALNPSLSSDGQTIAFETTAVLRLNLFPFVPPSNPPTNSDVYVRTIGKVFTTWGDHYTYLVSRHTSGAASTGESTNPRITPDGNRVVFRSDWSSFVNNDLNAVADIFLRDLSAGTTIRVSLGTFGVEPNASSDYSSLSDDGRFCAFRTTASNLTDNDFNGAADYFLRGPLD